MWSARVPAGIVWSFLMQRILVSILMSACAAAQADVLSQAQGLGVSHLTLQEVAPVQARDGVMLLSVTLDGRPVVLELSSYDIWSDSFTVVLDHGNGVREEITPGVSTAVRGVVLGEEGSAVAGSVMNGEARLLIATGDDLWTVQPAEGEAPGVHAVYHADDVLDHGGTCAVPNPAGGVRAAPLPGLAESDFGTRGSGDFRVAEIAIEADWQLFSSSSYNQNQNTLLNDINAVMAAMNTIYQRDVLLQLDLSHVLIRTSSASNPYTTNDGGGLLDQFANEWNTNQQGVPRDVAHLWTGRNISGSTIGIAYLATICTSSAYGVDQIRFTSNFNSRVGLFAHELGHNWSAEHCDGQSECRIMCSGLGGCNGLGNPVRFAPGPIAQINAFIPTRSCVDIPPLLIPFGEGFETTPISPLIWGTVAGFDTVIDGQAPAGSRVGRLTPSFAVLGTVPADTAVTPGSTIAVRFAVRPETSGSGSFRVTILDEFNLSQTVGQIAAFDPAQGYQTFTLQLPGSALNRQTPLRFSPTSGVNWRFDAIEVFEASSSNASASIPFAEDFERASMFLDRWQPSAGDVDDNEPGAPSGLYSLALHPGERAETARLLAGAAPDGIAVSFQASSPSDAGAANTLVVSYRDDQGVWQQGGVIAPAAVPASGFGPAEVFLPAAAAHNNLAVRFEAAGPATADAWRLDDILIEEGSAPNCPADLAAPFGVLDLGDINAFVVAFTGGNLLADLAAPFGVLDLGDLNAFAVSFISGCP
jgi:hypothetical protein